MIIIIISSSIANQLKTLYLCTINPFLSLTVICICELVSLQYCNINNKPFSKLFIIKNFKTYYIDVKVMNNL
jgi:hypothetical protein